jgi:hypothetical protein
LSTASGGFVKYHIFYEVSGLISISLANIFVPVSYDTDGLFTQPPVGCFYGDYFGSCDRGGGAVSEADGFIVSFALLIS